MLKRRLHKRSEMVEVQVSLRCPPQHTLLSTLPSKVTNLSEHKEDSYTSNYAVTLKLKANLLQAGGKGVGKSHSKHNNTALYKPPNMKVPVIEQHESYSCRK
jgi:hypothetical protein